MSGHGRLVGAGGQRVSFEVRACDDADGALRVLLVGEIDLGAADLLSARLGRIDPRERQVRLDLSELRFIDLSGLRAILDEVAARRSAGWNLEVDRRVSAAAGRLIEFAGFAAVLWPPDAPAARRTRAPAAPARADPDRSRLR